MSRLRPGVAVLSFLVLGAPALAAAADDAPGARTADDQAVATASRSTDQMIQAWLAAPAAQDRQDGIAPDQPPVQLDRKIHGEVGAAIGTGGYRSAYGVVNIPIGKTSSATLAFATGRSRGYGWGGPWLVGEGARTPFSGCVRPVDPMDAMAEPRLDDATTSSVQACGPR